MIVVLESNKNTIKENDVVSNAQNNASLLFNVDFTFAAEITLSGIGIR